MRTLIVIALATAGAWAGGSARADRVMLWTRVTQSAAGAVDVGWELARDALFASVVASGTTSENLTWIMVHHAMHIIS